MMIKKKGWNNPDDVVVLKIVKKLIENESSYLALLTLNTNWYEAFLSAFTSFDDSFGDFIQRKDSSFLQLLPNLSRVTLYFSTDYPIHFHKDWESIHKLREVNFTFSEDGHWEPEIKF